MNSILMAAVTFVLFIVAYHTYGKFLGRKILGINPEAITPAHEFRDGHDFVPTRKSILFGHHFASIAGTGPIVGPAVGVIWGWVPAMLWVVFGAILIGAVHDFSAIIVSARHQGKSIGELARSVVSPTTCLLFLFVIFFELLIVIAIFAMLIAVLFTMYPASVFPIWLEIPLAVYLGSLVLKKNRNPVVGTLIALAILYGAVWLASELSIHITIGAGTEHAGNIVNIVWVCILLFYAFVASILPVETLLQPRDFLNAFQLISIFILLLLGTVVANKPIVAPAFQPNVPYREPPAATLNAPPAAQDHVTTNTVSARTVSSYTTDSLPKASDDASTTSIPIAGNKNLTSFSSEKSQPKAPLWPLMFVVIACGAISGFHSLVGSGTTIKQLNNEKDARFIGYGGMLMEGALAILVIIAVTAGLGKEKWDAAYTSYVAIKGLGAKVGAFVAGASNFLESLHLKKEFANTLIAVFIVSFASTTLDSATRIQRHIVSELAGQLRLKQLSGIYPATFIAVGTALVLAFLKPGGTGALVLWPLFGTVNQLLAGLALLVVTVYLAKKGKPIYFTGIPMLFMIVMTGWAMVYNLTLFAHPVAGANFDYTCFVLGIIVFALELWMVFESAQVLIRHYRKKAVTSAEK